MAIKKILDSFNEFQTITSLLKSEFEIIETLSEVEIRLSQNIKLDMLKTLQETVQFFEIFCNPFSFDLDDVIDEIESSSIEIQEIESIAILLEKNSLLEEKGNLDYFFFNKNDALKMLSEIRISEENKVNIGIPDINELETETSIFYSLNSKTTLDDFTIKPIDILVKKNITFYLSNNKKTNQTFYNNPYSYIITSEYNKSEFGELIKNSFYLSMLDSLSDKIEDNHFILRGEKTISININNSFKNEGYLDFISIFNFLISEKKYTEKFIIVKKVFSLYIMDKENISDIDAKLNKIWKTINHYYDHYVEDNIKDFFKTKDQLLKEAMNVSKVVYEQTDKINNSIIASIFSVIILIATTLYRSIDQISIIYFFSIISIFILFSLVYYYLMANSSKERYLMTKSQFLYFINEISLMQTEEINELQNTYLEKPYKELKKTLNKLLMILLGINLLLILSFIIFLCVVHQICVC